MFSSYWGETHPALYSVFSVMDCVRISNHSYNVLEQAVLFCSTAENSPAEFSAPSALPLFAQEKALLAVQGNFWVEGTKLSMLQMLLEKECKKKLIKAEAEQFGHFPLSTVSSCSPAAKWHIRFGMLTWRKQSSRGWKAYSCTTPPKAAGTKAC